MAGDTLDNSLTGTSITIPYLALHSITVGGKIYWAKAFSLMTDQSIIGVQFSSDGELLIAHSYSSRCFIVVIKTSSGNILSARSYNNGGHINYNALIKSMLVSSGASPMAYVLSNYVDGNGCSGQ
jgi:hypothetical protein